MNDNPQAVTAAPALTARVVRIEPTPTARKVRAVAWVALDAPDGSAVLVSGPWAFVPQADGLAKIFPPSCRYAGVWTATVELAPELLAHVEALIRTAAEALP